MIQDPSFPKACAKLCNTFGEGVHFNSTRNILLLAGWIESLKKRGAGFSQWHDGSFHLQSKTNLVPCKVRLLFLLLHSNLILMLTWIKLFEISLFAQLWHVSGIMLQEKAKACSYRRKGRNLERGGGELKGKEMVENKRKK